MAGAHNKLGELLRHVRPRTAVVLHKVILHVCWLSKSYAHHQVTEHMARARRALRCGVGQVCPPRLGSLLLHVAYFLAVSWLGYLLLAELKFRAPRGDGRPPRSIDVFFTAVSAATVSSMSVVEMEVFSNGQLIVLTLLMLVGGEVFLSLMGLASKWSNLRNQAAHGSRRVESQDEGIELETPPPAADIENSTAINADDETSSPPRLDTKRLRLNAVRSLFLVVLAILLAVHVLGAVAIAAYIYSSPAARRTLRDKALNVWTFAVFTTVSTFSNCGFMPNNENMAAFPRDTGLQLLLVPQVLAKVLDFVL